MEKEDEDKYLQIDGQKRGDKSILILRPGRGTGGVPWVVGVWRRKQIGNLPSYILPVLL